MAELATPPPKDFKPYIAAETPVREFTLKAIVAGALFGILFGAATVYLALKAGLTVSASIPIAVIAISLGRKFLKTTILENNIIQTAGSAGESIAAGVVFTLPGFLFLSTDPATRISVGAGYFNYVTLFTLVARGRHPRRPHDDPAAPLAHREGARDAAVPGGRRLRLGAHRRREGRRLRQDRLPGRRHRGRPTPSCRRSSTSSPRRRPGSRAQTNKWLPERHRERRDHPRVPGRRLHHRPAASPACWSPAACSPGSASSRSSASSCPGRHGRAAVQLVKVGHRNPAGFGLGSGHPHLREHCQRHLPRLRPPDRRGRGGGRRLHHAAQDPPHHLHVAPRLASARSPTRPRRPACAAHRARPLLRHRDRRQPRARPRPRRAPVQVPGESVLQQAPRRRCSSSSSASSSSPCPRASSGSSAPPRTPSQA